MFFINEDAPSPSVALTQIQKIAHKLPCNAHSNYY